MAAPARLPSPAQSKPWAEPSADPRACLPGAESGCAETPLTSEPPLPDHEPLTSEPPLADTAPLTSEPSVMGAGLTGAHTDPTGL